MKEAVDFAYWLINQRLLDVTYMDKKDMEDMYGIYIAELENNLNEEAII